MPPTSWPSALAALRERTQRAHRALEASDLIMPATRKRDRFARLVGAMLAFHLAVEEQLRRHQEELEDGGVTMNHRFRSASLVREAAFLRAPVTELPKLDIPDAAHAAGALYVLEGATLGGVVIGNSIVRHLHFRSAYYGEFGSATAARWRDTAAQLESFAASTDERLSGMLSGAEQTFQALHEHLRAVMEAAG